MRIDLGPARLVSGRPGGLGGCASLRGRAGPALAGGFERRWAGSTDIFKVLSNLRTVLSVSRVPVFVCVPAPPVSFYRNTVSARHGRIKRLGRAENVRKRLRDAAGPFSRVHVRRRVFADLRRLLGAGWPSHDAVHRRSSPAAVRCHLLAERSWWCRQTLSACGQCGTRDRWQQRRRLCGMGPAAIR
jgi:hypothetical protein